jgi:predicted transcriptional regulator
MQKLDGKSLDILRLLKRGGSSILANTTGAQALMQRGLVTRIGGTHLQITEKGRGFIEGVDHVLRAL